MAGVRTPKGQAVQHPLLEKVRRCSTNPDEAVDFFTRVFDPLVPRRPTAEQALQHPYLQSHAYLMYQALLSGRPDGLGLTRHTSPVRQSSPVRESSVDLCLASAVKLA